MPEPDSGNIVFTALFTVELLINAFCHWFRPFATDPWCALDTFSILYNVQYII